METTFLEETLEGVRARVGMAMARGRRVGNTVLKNLCKKELYCITTERLIDSECGRTVDPGYS